LVTWYEMLTVPALKPCTTPPATLAIVVASLVHKPSGVASVSVISVPVHNVVAVPEIGATAGYRLTVNALLTIAESPLHMIV
jgi:hypothetical protein